MILQPADSREARPSFQVSELDYVLPPERIAQAPAERRADSRLLVLNRADGSLQDRRFHELPELLRAGDLLVLNDTRVIPARFELRRATGGRIDALFLNERQPGLWEVMLRNAGRARAGEPLIIADCGSRIADAGVRSAVPGARFVIRSNLGGGQYLIEVEPAVAALELLSVIGRAPLPPYIRRGSSGDAQDQLDAERYQTVYASRPGSVAAPTAGLHFTPELLDLLAGRGIEHVTVTLHVGAGTFAPVVTEDLRDHPMHAEWYELSPAAAERINRQPAHGGRVVAVGSTSVRVLESCPQEGGEVQPASGWTRLLCYPPYRFRAVDAMITNFHLPRSTLLALVMAFAGVKLIRRAYRHAIAGGYRFYSFGDAMLIG